jgi:hypothetical protein
LYESRHSDDGAFGHSLREHSFIQILIRKLPLKQLKSVILFSHHPPIHLTKNRDYAVFRKFFIIHHLQHGTLSGGLQKLGAKWGGIRYKI